MATDVSRNLMRSIQRGTVRTSPLPTGKAPTGVYTPEEGPADGQMASLEALSGSAAGSDELFAKLFSGEAAGVVDLPVPATPVSDSDLVLNPPLPDPDPAPATLPLQPGLSRAERFRSAPVVAGEPPREPSSTRASMESTPKAADAPSPVRSWSRFVDPADKIEAVTARQAMAAAKVITPLVAAVSFAPGTTSAGEHKSKALTNMLVGMHRSAVATAEAISEHMGKDVPSWMVTQLMQSMSVAIAQRWQNGQGADMDALASNMRSLFGASGPEFNELVKGASEDAYVEVNHPDIVRFRISVSAANAAWQLFDWVTHPRLSLDDKGDMPSRFFTFNQPPSDLVSKMLSRCVNECRGLVAQVESADLRTTHMQSSIARMANLIGAEYVTRTRHVMNWIGDPDISDAVYQERLDAAIGELDTRLLPEIYEHARVAFLRVEQNAFRTIEDLNEKTHSQLVPGGDNRPAGS